MFTFKLYLTEVYDVKPEVRYASHTKKSHGLHTHYFDIEHPSLSKTARVTIQHFDDTHVGETDIHGKKSGYEHLGNLGTKNVMHVAGRIKHHLPSHIESLSGSRLTGARKNLGTYGGISLKHVKPIPPDNE